MKPTFNIGNRVTKFSRKTIYDRCLRFDGTITDVELDEQNNWRYTIRFGPRRWFKGYQDHDLILTSHLDSVRQDI